MPDWKKLVEERLSALNLAPGAKDEVIAELAAHLEDASAAGPDPTGPENPVLADVPWQEMARAIERTKREEAKMNRRTKTMWLPLIAILFTAGLVLLFMNRAAILQRVIWAGCTALLLCAAATEANRLNQRTRSLWLPALTTFFGASVTLMLCQLFRLQPQIVSIGKIPMWFYWPWLAMLPAFGAFGACLSRRAHASISTRLAAGLSPALIMLTVMLIVLPWGLVLDGLHFFILVSFGLGLANWVALPAFALLLGALPFLGKQKAIRSQV